MGAMRIERDLIKQNGHLIEMPVEFTELSLGTICWHGYGNWHYSSASYVDDDGGRHPTEAVVAGETNVSRN